jgi:DNA-binding response OmpR family regulator
MATILYVDDEEIIGRLVERYFTRRGDAVLLARTIAEAQQFLGTTVPDSIFIDLRLGPENGFELMAWIHEERPQLSDRVAFVSGDAGDEEEHRRLWSMMGHKFIQKPFQLSELATISDGARSRATA